MLITNVFFVYSYKQLNKMKKIKVGQNNVLTIKEKKKNGVCVIDVHSTVFEDDPMYDYPTLGTDYSNYIINNFKSFFDGAQ